jgi:hypothetical protein
METERREIYYTNGRGFYVGQTDLENPQQAHHGNHMYYMGTYCPFKVLRDMEYAYYSGGSITARVLPAGVYRVVSEGDVYSPTMLERLGDDYTPSQRAERDSYWASKQ